MKKTLFALLLSLMMQPAMANPEPGLIDIARVKVAQSNLSNIGAGLDLWQKDHGGQYPARLSELEPNYLRQVPKAPSGEWVYRRGSDGKSYRVAAAGQPFQEAGIPGSLAYSSQGGLQALLPNSEPRLMYRLMLPADAGSEWKLSGRDFERDGEWISVRLCGPWTIDQSAVDWTGAEVEAFRSRPGATVLSTKSVRFGDLSGLELEGRWLGYRFHRYFLTDGQAGWEFDYSAKVQNYSPETDAMFLRMVQDRVRGE